MYVRFQSPTPGLRGTHSGVFALANGLARAGLLSDAEYADWRESNDWYNRAYPDPSAADPSVYDHTIHPLATAWFKSSATHLLERIPRYLEILRSHGVQCVRVEACDPGQVIYEDDVQVVVVPHPRDDEASRNPAAR